MAAFMENYVMTTKEKLQNASELIRLKQYDKARKILLTVNHPTATVWLKKIDALKQEEKLPDFPLIPTPSNIQPPPSIGRPWDPSGIMMAGMVTMWTVAGFGYGLNWRNLGKPQWGWNTILAFVGILTFMFAFGAVGYYALRSAHLLGTQVSILGLAVVLGLNLGLVGGLHSMQQGAYKVWKRNESPRALMNYEYDFAGALLIILLFPTVFVIGAFVFVLPHAAAPVYNNNALGFSYSNNFVSSDCPATQSSCKFAMEIYGVGQNGLYVTYGSLPLAPYSTVAELEEGLRGEYLAFLASYPDGTWGVTELTIDGHPAVIRESRFTDNGCENFGRRLYVQDGDTVYRFNFSWGCGWMSYAPEMYSILNTLYFND
jgi:hypothetical protein